MWRLLHISSWSVPGTLLVGEFTDPAKHSDSNAMIQLQSFTIFSSVLLLTPTVDTPRLSWQSERSPFHCFTCASIFHILGACENGHCWAGWVDSGEGRWQHPTYPRHPCGRELYAHWRLEWAVHRDLKGRVLRHSESHLLTWTSGGIDFCSTDFTTKVITLLQFRLLMVWCSCVMEVYLLHLITVVYFPSRACRGRQMPFPSGVEQIIRYRVSSMET